MAENGSPRLVRVSLAEVARQAGVSASIASRVLSSDPTVRARPETQARVRRIAESLGYQPHRAARALRLSRTSAIGLVVHDVTNPIHAEIIRGAQAALTSRGNVLLLADAEQLAQTKEAFAELLGPGRVDGLLWHGSGEAYDDAMIAEAAEVMPTVLVNSESRAGVPAVRLDDEEAAARAVEHLVSLGHKDIAFIGGSEGSDLTRRRERGYRRSLSEHGLAVRPELLIIDAWSPEAGLRSMERLRQEPVPPTAVFAANIVVATGVLAEATRSGLSVPGDLSVIAVHDTWFAALATPAISTVRLPLRRLGEQAAHRILERVAGGSDATQQPRDLTMVITEPEPELMVRDTTARWKEAG